MTHRITPYPHEARRFQEAGSVLIVREVDYQPEYGIVGESLICGPYLKERDDPGNRSFCPFPPVGEEVWFAEDNWCIGCFADDAAMRYSEHPQGIRWFVEWPDYEDPDSAARPRSHIRYPDSEDYALYREFVKWYHDEFKPRPATEMPEWAARLRGVVVSRECRRVETLSSNPYRHDELLNAGWPFGLDHDAPRSPMSDFRDHWNATSKTPFDADPWAWVVRIEKNPENR